VALQRERRHHRRQQRRLRGHLISADRKRDVAIDLAAVARPDIPRARHRRERLEHAAIAHAGGAGGGDEWIERVGRHRHSVHLARVALQSPSWPSSGYGHRGA
jgi:hypothetical protein